MRCRKSTIPFRSTSITTLYVPVPGNAWSLSSPPLLAYDGANGPEFCTASLPKLPDVGQVSPNASALAALAIAAEIQPYSGSSFVSRLLVESSCQLGQFLPCYPDCSLVRFN